MKYNIFSTKNEVKNYQLDAGISPTSTTIILKTGEGENFPKTYNGACTSLGTKNVLNCTGVGAILSTLDPADSIFIKNITDGSSAVIVAINTDNVVTTDLVGGTNNLWSNTDSWAIGSFIVTLSKKDITGADTTNELALIDYRTDDNLFVNSVGRGFGDSVAQSFNADDYCELRILSETTEGIQQAIASNNKQLQRMVKLDGIRAMEADLDLGNNNIINVADPVGANDAANKAYVDGLSLPSFFYSTTFEDVTTVRYTRAGTSFGPLGAFCTSTGTLAFLKQGFLSNPFLNAQFGTSIRLNGFGTAGDSAVVGFGNALTIATVPQASGAHTLFNVFNDAGVIKFRMGLRRAPFGTPIDIFTFAGSSLVNQDVFCSFKVEGVTVSWKAYHLGVEYTGEQVLSANDMANFFSFFGILIEATTTARIDCQGYTLSLF